MYLIGRIKENMLAEMSFLSTLKRWEISDSWRQRLHFLRKAAFSKKRNWAGVGHLLGPSS